MNITKKPGGNRVNHFSTTLQVANIQPTQAVIGGAGGIEATSFLEAITTFYHKFS